MSKNNSPGFDYLTSVGIYLYRIHLLYNLIWIFRGFNACISSSIISGNRNSMKGLVISTVLTSLSQVTAITAIIVYAVITFEKLGAFRNPFIAPILIPVTVIFGSLLSTFLADKLGRRKLNCLSLLLTACGLFATALFYYLNLNHDNFTAFSWIPVVSLTFSIFVSSAGIVPMGLICSVSK